MKLQEMLRRGDPAAPDAMLTGDERRRIRSRLSRIRPAQPSPAGGRWLVPAVAVGIGLVMLVVASNRLPLEPSSPVTSRPLPAPSTGETTSERAVQQIRFITPNGTQIVWLLETDE